MATFNLKEYTKKLDDWALIQSDPAVFNDMLKEYKVEDVKVQELYTLDFDELMEGPVHGLIFASKYTEDEDEDKDEDKDEDEDEANPKANDNNDPDAQNIVFTRQIITNVCATLALVAVLFNGCLQLGSILSDFKQLTANMSPEERGTALGYCEEIKRVHNSYDVSSKESG
ncbi:peptidase C12, ubiquitin carboxyl-terminal hydrolase [Pilobolus umbonatus]|nr:peptidase C12, ubiquitin carboxyl-terminal hydrolase [Pilobolus umbonatus]